MSYIAKFPFTESYKDRALARCDSVEETMFSAIKAFLRVKKKSRLGKNIGSSLPEMLYNLYNEEDLKVQESLIKQELIEQFAEFNFHSLKMEIKMIDKTSTLFVTIKLSTSISKVFEMVEIYEMK